MVKIQPGQFIRAELFVEIVMMQSLIIFLTMESYA